MNLELQLQKLSLELRNLSTYQLECMRQDTENSATVVELNCKEWNKLVGDYKASWDSLNTLSAMEISKNLSLIKLTDFMYIEGTIINPSKVMIDIGGGYIVRMSIEDAKQLLVRRGTAGMELAEFYRELFDRKRLVYFAINQALNNKIQAKVDKLEKEKHKEGITTINKSRPDDLAIQY